MFWVLCSLRRHSSLVSSFSSTRQKEEAEDGGALFCVTLYSPILRIMDAYKAQLLCACLSFRIALSWMVTQ